jgi:ABC-2 type transport system ATP-binding protein
MTSHAAVIATGLGKRYGRNHWGLRDCTLELPVGRVIGLVGPNGAGKTTLLQLVAGLLRPTEGTISVLGGRTPGEDPDLLPRVGFLAQEVPLYRSFRVREILEFGRRMNPRWDDELALGRVHRVGIDLEQRAGTLSGGQRAQVALALAMGKRPDLLLLDEPLASLDPLARREFLRSLMEGAAEGEVTIVLSSHLIGDLERVCDHLVVLSAARTQVAGDIENLLAAHRVLTGPRRDLDHIPGVAAVIQESHTDRQSTLVVRTDGPIIDPAWTVNELTLEDLVLAYLGQPNAVALPLPKLARTGTEVSR